MTPTALLAEVERRGIRLWADAGTLRLDAPRGAVTPALADALRTHKPELLALLRGAGLRPDPDPAPVPPARPPDPAPEPERPPARTWPEETARLAAWFAAAAAAGELPAAPFLLRPGLRVVDAPRFYAAVARDLADGPDGPRARILARDLARLWEVAAAATRPAE